jgi:FkbM family methyltransferase
MEEKNNHSPITIGNAVIKTDKKFFDSAKKVIRKEGFGSLIKKTSRAIYDTVRRFVREYIPLKYHYKRSSDGQVVRKVQDSFMFLDLRDTGISRELTLYGVHEKNSTAAIKRILKPGMKILECGANIGYYAMLEARLVGPTGKIYAVEPSPKNIAWLTRNIAINNYEHIEVIPGAFGAEKGTAPFYVDIRSNLSSFVKRDDLTEYEVVDVEMMNIDSFMALPDHDVDLIVWMSKAMKPRSSKVEKKYL